MLKLAYFQLNMEFVKGIISVLNMVFPSLYGIFAL